MSPLSFAREDEVLDAQRAFRVLLAGLARPGTVARLSAAPPVPPGVDARLAQIAQVLLDREVTFATDGAGPLARHVTAVTGSRWVAVGDADYLLASGGAPLAGLAALPAGTPEFPEAGATAVLSVGRLLEGAGDAPGGLTLTLAGPGIASEARVRVEGLHPENVETFVRRNADYPLGIDVFLIAVSGDVLGLPRTVHISRLEPA